MAPSFTGRGRRSSEPVTPKGWWPPIANQTGRRPQVWRSRIAASVTVGSRVAQWKVSPAQLSTGAREERSPWPGDQIEPRARVEGIGRTGREFECLANRLIPNGYPPDQDPGAIASDGPRA